jgi:hypothetical protein
MVVEKRIKDRKELLSLALKIRMSVSQEMVLGQEKAPLTFLAASGIAFPRK